MLHDADFLSIASQFGTPSFLYDLQEAQKQVKRIRDAVPENVELCFAVKANTFLSSFFAEQLDRVEVCSPGELEVCRSQGVAPDKIVFSGVNKEPDGVRDAITFGVGILTIESLRHAQLIEEAAASLDRIVSVIVRLASGGQFGVDRSTLLSLFANRTKYPHLDFIGVHYFTGTQKKRKNEIERELLLLCQVCEEIQAETGCTVRHIEYGPGIGVSYYEQDKDGDFDGVSLLDQLRDAFQSISQSYRLTLEMGRLFAADCGHYLTSVNDVKLSDDVNFCIIDGGINNINYYGQMMGMKIPPIRHLPIRDASPLTYTVCGSLCTFQDVLLRKYDTFPLEIGDLLVFQKLGAYSATEGINLFLTRDLPQILLYDGQQVTVKRPFFHTSVLNG